MASKRTRRVMVAVVVPLIAGLLVTAVAFGQEKNTGKIACLRIGHRGAATLAPENTIPAIRAAIQAGVDGIEFDVHTTADHKMIVIHDGDLARTTNGGKARVTTKTLAELRQLDAGNWGDWKGGKFAGEKLPLPEEIIQEIAIGGVIPVVHIKDREVIPGIMHILEEEKIMDRAIMFSFDYTVIEQFAKEYPNVKKGWIWGKRELDESGGLEGAIAKAVQAKCDLVNPRSPLVTPELIAACRAAKLPVYTWTINDKPEMETLIRMGVNGILTDDVPLLNATLDEMNGHK